MKRISMSVLLAVGLSLGAAACGGGDLSGADAELVDRLVEELGAPRGEAECLVKEAGQDAQVLLFDEDSTPDADDLDKLTAVIEAGEKCAG